jgi:acetyl-CoA decarbonylase/synthase complex subunit gamma
MEFEVAKEKNAGKVDGEKIAKFIKEIKLEERIKTRKIVIPGFVSQISGDFEEKHPGWEVIVGCQEVSDFPKSATCPLILSLYE